MALLSILTAARDTTVPFEESFFEDPDTQTVPLVPIDASQYPSVTVRDPDGQIIRQGVGALVMPGVYRFDVPIPADAALSTPDKKWSIQWVLYTATGRSTEHVRYFDVVETKIPSAEDRAPYLLVREGKAPRVSIQLSADPFELSAQVKQWPGGSPIETVAYNPNDAGASPIKKVVEKGAFTFYFRPTVALAAGEYAIFWDYLLTETANEVSEMQHLMVPPDIAWFLMKPLKALIDKLKKKANRLQAYTTAELYGYLLAGVDILNQIPPVTNAGLCDLPYGSGGTRTALMYAAGLHAMRSQHILAVESDFDFSGRTVPLRIDRKQGYADAAQKMLEGVKEWAVAKFNLWRQSNSMGAVTARLPQRRFQNLVVPISTGTGQETFTLLSGLGLL